MAGPTKEEFFAAMDKWKQDSHNDHVKQLIDAMGLSPEYFYDTTWEKLLDLLKEQQKNIASLKSLIDRL
jgi:hypothetical protein